MRRSVISTLVCTSLVLIATIANADTTALDVTSSTSVLGVGSSLNNVGWQFSVSSTITVTSLGVFDVNPAGLAENHEVGIWNSSGTLLASTTVTNASTMVSSASGAGNWLFQGISPLTLGAGTYVIGAFYSANNTDDVMLSTTISNISAITYLSSRASSSGSFGEPDVYGLFKPGVFGPDFTVQATTPTPEPASVLLLTCGLSAIVLRRLRK